MKQQKTELKAHHHLAIVSMLLFGVVSVWGWGSVVFASTSEFTVHIGPPDSCVNIPGYQDSVPAGMTVDASGNCATPNPPPEDVCDNIPEVQTAIPAGFYREISGDCLPQTTPPQDVCNNLPGTQVFVPSGFYSTLKGTCEAEPFDVCMNIEGPQFPVPTGMDRTKDGVCFTPAPVAPNPTPPDETPISPAPTGKTDDIYSDLKNVPDALHPLLMPLVNIIPENVRAMLRSTPPEIARTFPYLVFAVLGIAAIIIAAQALLEAQAYQRLAALLRRERDIAEEKDSFIALASHYLRTPLTIMSGSISTLLSAGETTSETVAALQNALDKLGLKISSLLADIDNNSALQSIKYPAKDLTQPSFLLSGFFWAPIVSAFVIMLLSNFLLGVVGNIELGTVNLWAQVIVLVVLSSVLYASIRNRYLKTRERQYEEALISHENAIDEARNEFIHQALLVLSAGMEEISKHRSSLKGTRSEAYFDEGVERFNNMLKKFSLLSQIQTGLVGVEERFDIKSATDLLIQSYQPELNAKSLTMVNNIAASSITQRRSLFDFVLGSLIDNAIKFSNQGGTIYLNSAPEDHSLVIKISDYGPVISEEKMPQLFKPFSRGTSAMEFNYEGLGFSLFLDKIIMDYVGGEISAVSSSDSRTTFSVKTHTA